MAQRPTGPDTPSHVVQVAQMWAKVPPEHLEVAFRVLEPELQREHEYRLEVLRQAQRDKDQAHRRYVFGLVLGFAIAVAMLAGAVVVGVQGHVWLSLVLTGPSLLALAKLFVIRRADNEDTRLVARHSSALANGASGGPPGTGVGVP